MKLILSILTISLLLACGSQPIPPPPLSLIKGGIVCASYSQALSTFTITSNKVDTGCMIVSKELIVLEVQEAAYYNQRGLVHIVTSVGNGVTHISQLNGPVR